MLTATYLDVLPEPVLALYEEYMQSVLNDIARRLAKAGKVTPTAAWQMQRLAESGQVYETALNELAALSGKSEATLRTLFGKAGVQTMRFDDAVYRAAGLDPLPLNLSPAMAQVLAAGLRKTGGIMNNLTMTTANSAQQAYIHAADLAYMQIAGGAMDYQSAIKMAIKRAASEGLMVQYPTGHRDQLDVALRRTILTGVNQTAGQLQTTRADEMGADLVQTSAHIGARPSHQVWQGRIFSRSGRHSKYPDFVKETGYGTGPGLMGWSCRHSFYPYFEGISAVHYQRAELRDYANKTVTYNGQEMSFYDATQKQRSMERAIRKTKREVSALDAGGIDNTDERLKLGRQQSQLTSFAKQTGLQRQRFREQAHELGKQPRALYKTPSRTPAKGGAVAQMPREAINNKVVVDQGAEHLAAKVKPGMEAINQVHSVEGMPKVLLSPGPNVPELENAGGFYAGNAVRSTDQNDPKDLIVCRPNTMEPNAAFVHEYGHMVDHRGFGEGDLYASKRAATTGEGPMAEWWTAVQQTPEYKHMQEVINNPDAFVYIEEDMTGKYRVTPNVKYAQYLSDPTELWARSYAQYIGQQTGHQYNFEGQGKTLPMAWGEESFGPVSKAIDALLRSKGWLR